VSERSERGPSGPRSGEGDERFAPYEVVRYVPVPAPAATPEDRPPRPPAGARPERPGLGAIAAGVVSAIVRAALMAVRQ
jgi:hypothetical protein